MSENSNHHDPDMARGIGSQADLSLAEPIEHKSLKRNHSEDYEDENEDENSHDAIDDDDEDEDEDEEEDREDENDKISTKDPMQKRIKRRAVELMFDREAEVDDDDDEEDAQDEDEQEILRDFIEPETIEDPLSGPQRSERRHRELDQLQERVDEADAVRLAAQFRERYGRSGGAYRGDQQSVPRRLLLPSVHDPSIWAIRCKKGREDEIVFNLLWKHADRSETTAPIKIFSAFARAHSPGYVYIEAAKKQDVLDAVADVSNLYVNKLVLVPVAEMPDLLRVRNTSTALVPGAFVRIRKNNKRYAGDLGRVQSISTDSTEAHVALVPRLDYASQEDLMRKTLTSVKQRPTARLFNPANVEKLTGTRLRGHSEDNSYMFNNESYHDGLLIKSFRIAQLITEPEEVKPTLEEVQAFSGGDGLHLATLGQGVKSRVASFTIGDNVEVSSGEQKGLYGVVESISKNIVELRTTDVPALGTISVPTWSLRKRFSLGQEVRVLAGAHTGESGLVVTVKDDIVIFVTNMGKTEITVFSKDLGETNGVSETPSVSRFEVRDVVELNRTEFGCVVKVENTLIMVLMASGDLRTVKADTVARKIPPPKSGRLCDRYGNTIRVSAPHSTVQECSGKGRKGKVFNMHLHTVFCHNIEIAEHNGIFVANERDVETTDLKVVDYSKQNPMLRSGHVAPPPAAPRVMGRDKAIGQDVWIRRGPKKGLMGIVTNTTATHARIEPHSGLNQISVQKELLGFRITPEGPMISYEEFVNSRGGRDTANQIPQPSVDTRPLWAQPGNRIPNNPGAQSSYGSGARTPAWAGGGSRTPAWSSNTGSATPAWAGAGSKTPSWNSSGQGDATPAWISGSKTPSWSAGNATPAWQPK